MWSDIELREFCETFAEFWKPLGGRLLDLWARQLGHLPARLVVRALEELRVEASNNFAPGIQAVRAKCRELRPAVPVASSPSASGAPEVSWQEFKRLCRLGVVDCEIPLWLDVILSKPPERLASDTEHVPGGARIAAVRREGAQRTRGSLKSFASSDGPSRGLPGQMPKRLPPPRSP